SRRRHTRLQGDWSSDVCSSDLNAALGFVLFVLALLTARQCFIYKSEDTVWRDTLLKNPNCWLAHNNLGVNLMEGGSSGGAEEHRSEERRVGKEGRSVG